MNTIIILTTIIYMIFISIITFLAVKTVKVRTKYCLDIIESTRLVAVLAKASLDRSTIYNSLDESND